MALTNKVHMPKDAPMAIVQASSFFEHKFETPTEYTSPNYIINQQQASTVCRDPESPEKSFGLGKSNSSSVSSTPSSINSNNFGFSLSGEDHSMISFIHATGSLPGFEQNKRVQRNLFSEVMEDEYPMWEHDYSYHSPKSNTYHGLPEASSSSHHAATHYRPSSGGVQLDWLNDQEGTTIIDCTEEQMRQEAIKSKRPSTGESVQALKKQCVGGSKKTNQKPVSPCKDPQSSAAKNRRERISDRLKILQELVPNGTKVDLVTMLEKAVGYVKFLQLQVKVLATDEFWPAPGGKAPDLTQVKEAIDAILACQRGTSK